MDDQVAVGLMIPRMKGIDMTMMAKGYDCL